MEATKERTMKSKYKQTAEALVKNYVDNEWWTVERKDLEELDVYLKLKAWWAVSGSYGVDEQRLVATAMAGAFAGEELRIQRLWDWRQKLGGMIELAVRKTVRWMR